jgi:uncharacterized protein (DUF1501 family)
MLNRRFFLRGSAIVMAGLGSAPKWLARAADGAKAKRKILVAIFQRGAADGLNVVVPFGEKRYYELRPSIGIQKPNGTPANGPNGNTAIDLDGSFGLHPQLQPLKALWDKQQLAIVEATGSPDPTRSHFDAQDYMESGTPGKASSDGWLNRALSAPGPETSPLRAISVGAQLPHILRGERAAIAVSEAQQFQLGGSDTASVLESMYQNVSDARLEKTGKDAFAAMKMIKDINAAQYQPQNGAQYFQGGDLGRGLQQIARMIRRMWAWKLRSQRLADGIITPMNRDSCRTCCGSLALRWRRFIRIWATGWKTSLS